MNRTFLLRFLKASAFFCALAFIPVITAQPADTPAKTAPQHPVLTGQAAFTDAAHESPGIRRHLTAADLPAPSPEQSVDNGATIVPRTNDNWPIAPKGFKVELYASGLDNPRLLRTAPNGDLFLAESATGKIKVFRGVGSGRQAAKQVSVFASGLHQPFGIAFYPSGPNPEWVYIGDTDGIVRFPYKNGDLKARGPVENLAELPGGGRLRGGGHWTRDLVFSQDGTKLFASVGSHSNVDDPDTHPEEFHRADVLEFTPAGQIRQGLRVGACATAWARPSIPPPASCGAPPMSATALGNNLVPDYVTHVQEGGFYGWPWYYMGGPTAACRTRATTGKHPELQVQGDYTGHPGEPPLRIAGNALLRGLAVPRRVQRRRIRRRARLLEPRPALRL